MTKMKTLGTCKSLKLTELIEINNYLQITGEKNMQKINIYQARELPDNGQSIIITSGNDIIEVNKKQLFYSGKQQKLNRKMGKCRL